MSKIRVVDIASNVNVTEAQRMLDVVLKNGESLLEIVPQEYYCEIHHGKIKVLRLFILEAEIKSKRVVK
jgi:hypothetical protein